MKSSNFTTTILEAVPGCYLTQVAEVPVEERIIASRIALGKHDSTDNYREIGEEEANAYKTEIEALRNERIENEGNQVV